MESKKIALHSLIKQITVYANATLEVAYNASYLTNQTRALEHTLHTGVEPVKIFIYPNLLDMKIKISIIECTHDI